MVGKTRSPRAKSLAPTIVQNTPSSSEMAPAHYLGRSKVTLLSPTLSTQTQAEKPIGKGRTVTPLTFQTNASVRHGSTPLPIPPARPHSYLVGAKSPSPREAPFSRAAKPQPLLHGAPTAPISQPPSSLMPETLSNCRRALGRVPLTPCCWSCLDDGRVNRTGADSSPPLFTAPERLQLRIRPESRRSFHIAVDHRDIYASLPPVATTTAPTSPTRKLGLPTSLGRQIGHTLISNHFI